MEKTLYHSYSDKICAYCELHECGMTVKQMKKKQCLQKQCHYFHRNENHQIWYQRELVKNHRKVRKEALRLIWEQAGNAG